MICNIGTGLSAFMMRFHHVIGDGIAMVGLMTKIFTDEQGEVFSLDIPEKMGGGTARQTSISRFFSALLSVATLPSTPYDTSLKFHNVPDRTKMKMGKKFKTILFPVLKLDFVKKLKNSGNVTVNDVLMALVSGSIRR